MKTRKIGYEKWLIEARQKFGDDTNDWKFVCPSCGYVASVREWRGVGAGEGELAFSCIGRHIDGITKGIGDKTGGPCDYAGGGLFRLNPVHVIMEDGRARETFEFASVEE